jgi:hypothetical protein
LQAHGLTTRDSYVRHRAPRRKILASKQRITARFQVASGGTLHVRKATMPDAETAAINRALGPDSKPGGIQKRHLRPERDL